MIENCHTNLLPQHNLIHLLFRFIMSKNNTSSLFASGFLSSLFMVSIFIISQLKYSPEEGISFLGSSLQPAWITQSGKEPLLIGVGGLCALLFFSTLIFIGAIEKSMKIYKDLGWFEGKFL